MDLSTVYTLMTFGQIYDFLYKPEIRGSTHSTLWGWLWSGTLAFGYTGGYVHLALQAFGTTISRRE